MTSSASSNIQNNTDSDAQNDTSRVYKVYPRRFGILVIFCICSLSSSFQWIEYVIIQNIIVRYYNESLPESYEAKNNAVTWTSLLYMVTYIPLMFPAMWLLDRHGLKITCSTGAFLNGLGAFIKCFSVGTNRWWIAFTGQIICACAQSFTLGVPPYIAATWFSSNSVSTVGIALGFLIPSRLIPDVEDLDLIGQRLRILYYLVAFICISCFIAMIIVFQRLPPTPPSRAQEIAQHSSEQNYAQTLKRLLTNRWFLLLLLAYGLNTGAFYSISTLLNPVYMWYFDKKTEHASKYAGTIGMLLVIGGIFGSLIGGYILDKSKAYKTVTFGVYVLSFLSMALFTATIHLHEYVAFVTMIIVGFFMTGYLPIGFEYGVEITYPENEAISSSLLNVSAQVFGLCITQLQEYLIFKKEKILASNIMLCGALIVGAVITMLIRSPLRRQNAQHNIHILIDDKNLTPVVSNTNSTVNA
ncbi:unnamed protein product [Rotaria sp. Silwood1]|nr:unnamed protein product [Rotaria sp. Silwood1]CAF3490740.1 unnamed protein product [Rotaria sp. Silwood1]CAF3505416.1 unnamed protein product [Rotaria sp. Silwood1]CAF4608122.1 unnamed protein product [Rotaria sp. Silwood1]CAF4675588.1 unnamed protein product [Rotaria sp. Silwood1]